MTDVVSLAAKLYSRIQWQEVPEEVGQEDLTCLIADAIRTLYVMTGRALQFDESKFVLEEGLYLTFADDLQLDEKEYV